MSSIRSETIVGFDVVFIAEQHNVPSACKVRLSQFDDQFEERYADPDVAGRHVPGSDSARWHRPSCQ